MSLQVPPPPPLPSSAAELDRLYPLQHARELFARFYQVLFYHQPPGRAHWDEDDKRTEIIITSETPLDPKVLGKRPALVITRSPSSNYHLGFNDDLEALELDTGTATRTLMHIGQMVITAVARTYIESENLCMFAQEQLWARRHMLIGTNLFYEVGRQLSVGAPTPASAVVAGDSGREYYATSFAAPYQLLRTVRVTPLGQPILDEVCIDLNAEKPPARVHRLPTGGVQVLRSAPGVLAGRAPHPLNPEVEVEVRVARQTAGTRGAVRLRRPLVPGSRQTIKV